MFGLYMMLEAGRAGLGLMETGRKLSETLLAANSVIDRRSHTIRSAFHDPIRADRRELARMVTEKQQAFGRSGAVLLEEWLAWQSFWTDALADAADGLRPGRTDVSAMTGGFDAWTRLIAAPGKALGPVHKAATGNARRLRRRR